MTTDVEQTRIVLDPLVSDLDGESAALRAAGPLAAVELPGGAPVWAVTHHAETRQLLTGPRLVKDGAALSRLEAGVALPALYTRFPSLDLAVPADELRNKPVVTQNDLYELPVRLRR